jgi:hypothetical protein
VANNIDNPRKVRKTIIQPTTREFAAWPAWWYHPKTGIGRVFENEDEVPEGWVNSLAKTKPGKVAAREDDVVEVEAETEQDNELLADVPDELEDIENITVSEIKNRLRVRNIPFANSADKSQLYQLLEENWELEEGGED